jgi:hypothetical protein
MTHPSEAVTQLAITVADDIIDRVQSEFPKEADANAAIFSVLGYLVGVLDLALSADRVLNASNQIELVNSFRACGRLHPNMRQTRPQPKGAI